MHDVIAISKLHFCLIVFNNMQANRQFWTIYIFSSNFGPWNPAKGFVIALITKYLPTHSFVQRLFSEEKSDIVVLIN